MLPHRGRPPPRRGALLLLAALLPARGAALRPAMPAPDPLGHTNYSSEHDNYLCVRRLGRRSYGDNYQLPCRAPREDWRPAPLRGTFPIAAWWPPNIAVLDSYADAHFNVLLGGNLARNCQEEGLIPSPATAEETFACVVGLLPKIDRLGLKLSWFHGHYNSTNGLAAVQGGAFGGVIERAPTASTGVFYVSQPEVAWIVSELARRNLSHTLYSMFLRDDVVTAAQSVVESVTWLRQHAPHILPQVNGG